VRKHVRQKTWFRGRKRLEHVGSKGRLDGLYVFCRWPSRHLSFQSPHARPSESLLAQDHLHRPSPQYLPHLVVCSHCVRAIGEKREEQASPAPRALLERTHNRSLGRPDKARAAVKCSGGQRRRADLYDSIELVHGGRARKCWLAPQHLFETGVSLSKLNTAGSLLLHPIMCGMTAAVWPPARVVHVPCTFHRPCETSPRLRGLRFCGHICAPHVAQPRKHTSASRRRQERGGQATRQAPAALPPASPRALPSISLAHVLCSVVAGYPAADNGLGDGNAHGQTRKASGGKHQEPIKPERRQPATSGIRMRLHLAFARCPPHINNAHRNAWADGKRAYLIGRKRCVNTHMREREDKAACAREEKSSGGKSSRSGPARPRCNRTAHTKRMVTQSIWGGLVKR
jgi:hypothetical protein